MGGEFGRLGGLASGAARNRAALSRVVLVRNVVPASAATSRSSKASKASAPARPTAAEDDAAYMLLRRSMAEVEAQKALIAELQAENKERQLHAADLERRLSDADRRRFVFEPAPSALGSRRGGAASILGNTPADRETLTGVKRGAVLEMKPKATYGAYKIDDVYALGQQIKDGSLTLADIRKGAPGEYAVPYTTMMRWCAPVDELGTPKWLYARDVQRLTKKPRARRPSGPGTARPCSRRRRPSSTRAAMYPSSTRPTSKRSCSRARAAGRVRQRASRTARCSPRRRRLRARGARR